MLRNSDSIRPDQSQLRVDSDGSILSGTLQQSVVIFQRYKVFSKENIVLAILGLINVAGIILSSIYLADWKEIAVYFVCGTFILLIAAILVLSLLSYIRNLEKIRLEREATIAWIKHVWDM